MSTFPYPGFSWSITQHVAPATESATMFALLNAAHNFSDDADYRNKITNDMIDQGLLTPNYREDAGQPQLWRDYQQILPELGLIVSTRFTKGVAVTPVGLMWLDGAIGYSELITTQVLRYQYPNGHKQDISASAKNELLANGYTIPTTRTQLDAEAGVLIKPAVLILRILLQLFQETGKIPHLTVDECLSALVPTKMNQDWIVAFNNLLEVRRNGIPRGDSRRKRHIQEWFRLLDLADIFEQVKIGRVQAISLSSIAIENIEELSQLCDYHEQIESFWIPDIRDNSEMALSWFRFFGTPNINSQWLLPEELKHLEYVENNYPAGAELEEDFVDLETLRERDFEINLQPFVASEFTDNATRPRIDPHRIAQGHESRQRSTRLHEKIVALLAEKLQNVGYSVMEDRQSVDLLASRDSQETLIEVKTVTRNNIYRHMRLGVGQLSEYRYRRQLQVNNRPAAILVISSDYNFPEWTVNYFNDDVKLGLMSLATSDSFHTYTEGETERVLITA